MPLPPLRLLHHPHRLPLYPHHPRSTHKIPLVHPRIPAVCVFPGAETRGPRQAQHGSWDGVRHVEGQAEGVARGEEVGAGVQVGDYVVGGLGGEEGEEGGGWVGGGGGSLLGWWWRGLGSFWVCFGV